MPVLETGQGGANWDCMWVVSPQKEDVVCTGLTTRVPTRPRTTPYWDLLQGQDTPRRKSLQTVGAGATVLLLQMSHIRGLKPRRRGRRPYSASLGRDNSALPAEDGG